MAQSGLDSIGQVIVEAADIVADWQRPSFDPARALLVDSFAVARDHGSTRFERSTDAHTGAVGLYEKVGMQVSATWRHWAIDTERERGRRHRHRHRHGRGRIW